MVKTAPHPYYTYAANLPDGLASIHDGDTLHATIQLGFEVTITDTIRLYGVNAPELSTPEGKTAKNWVIAWFTQNCPNNEFIVTTVRDKKEKYGRYLATIQPPGNTKSLNQEMVDAGQAVPYFPT